MSETMRPKGGDLFERRPWYELPPVLAALRLIGLRDKLRALNLYDTEEPPLAAHEGPADPAVKASRTFDGAWNDLAYPHMGAAGARFGQNVPLEATFPDTTRLLVPNPQVVSQALLARTTFQPATSLNLLAAAWIQFMVHDWFAHRPGPKADGLTVPIPDGDPWPERPMRVARTEPDPPRVPGSTRPPAYANPNSHWWDGSQIYGSDEAAAAAIRTHDGGRVQVGTDGRLLVDPVTGREVTCFSENGWLGLSLFHALFAMEHNAICDRLKAAHGDWTDQQLYDRARLINTALMAKIHTIEWTPAILPHPVITLAMHTNWHGLVGEPLQEAFRALNDNELLGGIIGSHADHHAAPYSLTEEFVAVYRMHPLIPDAFTFRSAGDDAIVAAAELPEVTGRDGIAFRHRLSYTDFLYSFGRMHPGAIRLHNYPRHLLDLVRDDGERIDLGTIDILRDRERGVPRYNQFRRLLGKPPVASFEELTGDTETAEEIRRVYDGDLEAVDLMVGLFAEPLPEGFGFSETAFRIFILMASRRLKSDRFFTDDYTAATYTQFGLDWVDENSLVTVLLRHFPGLGPALRGVDNAFRPWPAVSGA